MIGRIQWLAARLSYWVVWRLFIGTALVVCAVALAFAGPREQAQRMHDRITGVPPAPSELAAMVALLPGNPLAAALLATQNRHFYTVTLKNFAAPWTNRDQSAFVPLNDYTALVIGLVRDNRPFTDVLTADLLYVGNGNGLPAPSAASNAHYEALERRMLETSFNPHSELVAVPQSSIYPLPAAATAGAMTSRAAAEAFFIAGTNRAMFRFTLMNHLCLDLEQVHDTSVVPDRIRQDVSRSPGGDSRVFLNNCIGCHAGMDPLAQAFAHYDFSEATGSIRYDAAAVHPKYFNNDDTFPDGFATPDDSWANYWREGQNALLGWDPSLPGAGTGAKTLGEELARSQTFAQCQVKKVFKAVCLRDPEDAADRTQVDAMVSSFRGGNFNLRNVFAESAVYCRGD